MDNPSSDADYLVLGPGSGGPNPYWVMLHDVDTEKRGRFIGFGKINYEFTDWLSGFIRVSADVTDVNSLSIRKPGHHKESPVAAAKAAAACWGAKPPKCLASTQPVATTWRASAWPLSMSRG